MSCWIAADVVVVADGLGLAFVVVGLAVLGVVVVTVAATFFVVGEVFGVVGDGLGVVLVDVVASVAGPVSAPNVDGITIVGCDTCVSEPPPKTLRTRTAPPQQSRSRATTGTTTTAVRRRPGWGSAVSSSVVGSGNCAVASIHDSSGEVTGTPCGKSATTSRGVDVSRYVSSMRVGTYVDGFNL